MGDVAELAADVWSALPGSVTLHSVVVTLGVLDQPLAGTAAGADALKAENSATTSWDLQHCCMTRVRSRATFQGLLFLGGEWHLAESSQAEVPGRSTREKYQAVLSPVSPVGDLQVSHSSRYKPASGMAGKQHGNSTEQQGRGQWGGQKGQCRLLVRVTRRSQTLIAKQGLYALLK